MLGRIGCYSDKNEDVKYLYVTSAENYEEYCYCIVSFGFGNAMFPHSKWQNI